MPQSRQLSFLPRVELAHGGDATAGKRKCRRPIDPKRPLHVTLRSRRAKGGWSMLRKPHKHRVFLLAHALADRYRVKIHRFENVGNHLHLLISVPSRREFQAFLRVLAGQIVFVVTGACKSHKVGRFWDKLAYSRVVSWGREFRAVMKYLSKNAWEALGVPRPYLLSLRH